MKTDGLSEYEAFLASKAQYANGVGFNWDERLPYLFEFQNFIAKCALKRGRCAIFAETGLGKTRMELAWAEAVSRFTGLPVLILAPLGVARQTVREGVSVGVHVTFCREQSDIRPGVNIANYQILHKFSPVGLGGIVCDESSVLKSFNGATKQALVEFVATIDYRLAATATPSPNDYTELGNHAEFLGVMTRAEMLAMFFIHDGGETSVWRLRGWAHDKFWAWVASWAIMCRKPSDVGFPHEDARYILPALTMHDHRVVSPNKDIAMTLFESEAHGLSEQRTARRDSTDVRVSRAVEIVATKPDATWAIWVDTNAEQDMLESIYGRDAISIRGSTKEEEREGLTEKWMQGTVKKGIFKRSVFGFGMNLQCCHNAVSVGVDNSDETEYQVVRRHWRFGQTQPVDFHTVYSEREAAVVRNRKRKRENFETMQEEMVQAMKSGEVLADVKSVVKDDCEYVRDVRTGPDWTNHLGDCVEVLREMESESIGYSIFSPPFASLYTYSASRRDLGNCKTHSEFYAHFQFAVKELHRVMQSGRLVSFHCMNIPTSKERDGYIGTTDFRGNLIRMFQAEGFIYHSEVLIWKDPVTSMQRTKALGLLHKQIVKDSCMSRQGIPDYLVTMRKPGANENPVAGMLEEYHGEESAFLLDVMGDPRKRSIEIWQRYASPVWMDINPSDTLQYRNAREGQDERHICPLQLTVIKRGIQLWSNPGDVVLSPFSGISSEGWCALEMDRQFVGIELKKSYFEIGCNNLQVKAGSRQIGLNFDEESEQ